MNNVTNFTKNYFIGELEFTISVNRFLATSIFKKYPKYYNTVLKQEEIVKVAKNVNSKNVNDIANSIKINDVDTLISYLDTVENLQKYSKEIVDNCLYQLLEYAETELPSVFSTYEEYAKEIIRYCEENDILYNYYLEDENEETEPKEQQGFYDSVMEFLSMGFTQGNTKKKSKLQIKTN